MVSLCYSGQKKLFFLSWTSNPSTKRLDFTSSLSYKSSISFTKIIVVHITIIFIWTTEIAIKLIFLHIFSLSSNQFFLQCSYWTFQMASPTMLSSCIKSVSDFQCSQNTDKLISHVLQRSSGFGLFIQYYLAADNSYL